MAYSVFICSHFRTQGKLATDCDGSVEHRKWQEPAGTLSVALTAYMCVCVCVCLCVCVCVCVFCARTPQGWAWGLRHHIGKGHQLADISTLSRALHKLVCAWCVCACMHKRGHTSEGASAATSQRVNERTRHDQREACFVRFYNQRISFRRRSTCTRTSPNTRRKSRTSTRRLTSLVRH